MPQNIEGIVVTDDTLEVIAYLQTCYEQMERGEEDHILGDPFYQRAGGKPMLTDEEVDKVVAAIDAEFATEIGQYPGYHRNRSGATHTPDFHRLSARARRAMVEGLDAILARHRAPVHTSAPVPETQAGGPDYTGG